MSSDRHGPPGEATPPTPSGGDGVDRVDGLDRMIGAHALLADVARQIGPALDLESTLAGVLTAMRRLVSFRGGSICLVEDGQVHIAAADPPVSDEVARLRLPVGEGLAGRIIEQGQVIYCPNLDEDPRVDPEVRRLGSNKGITSYLGVPLVTLGRVIGLMQVDSPAVDAFDETDRTLLEGLGAQMANAIESARQFDEVMRLEAFKQSILTMISHELRTPLTIARGFVMVLGEPGIDPDQHAYVLERTSAAIDRMTDLVEHLILMSQIAGGEVAPTMTDVPAAEVVDTVLSEGDLADHISVEATSLGDWSVSVDPHLSVVMLRELADNAVKYAGGAEISAEPVGHELVVRIRDRGPGIPADLRGHEFDEFIRGWSNSTTIAGLGLGLATAGALARMTGAHVQLDDAPGGGTVASVRLPLAAGAETGAAHAEDAASRQGP